MTEDTEDMKRAEAMFARLASAITLNVSGGTDAVGGNVECLTEAVMGTTAGLVRIANAINNLAEAVREQN